MCGILGSVNFKDKIDDDRFLEALNMMQSRGPDSSDKWKDAECNLGHRRLSIIDLSDTGNQPMISHNERYVCVLNGEIYNYNNLKIELNKY
jgi:asparagine synthase (glutamine-hydrolysing)